MDPNLHRSRLSAYATQHLNFGIYYDKIYKKEYLPTRIRYNQFFFYFGLASCCYLLLKKGKGGGLFCKMDEADPELANRRYFTSERSVVNLLMRQMNKSSMSSHMAKQDYTFWSCFLWPIKRSKGTQLSNIMALYKIHWTTAFKSSQSGKKSYVYLDN